MSKCMYVYLFYLIFPFSFSLSLPSIFRRSSYLCSACNKCETISYPWRQINQCSKEIKKREGYISSQGNNLKLNKKDNILRQKKWFHISERQESSEDTSHTVKEESANVSDLRSKNRKFNRTGNMGRI